MANGDQNGRKSYDETKNQKPENPMQVISHNDEASVESVEIM